MSDPTSNLIVRCQANVRTCEKINDNEYSMTIRPMAWGLIEHRQNTMMAQYTKPLQQNTEHYFEGQLYFEQDEEGSTTKNHCYVIFTSEPLPFPFPYHGPGLDCEKVEFDVTAYLDTIQMSDIDDESVDSTIRVRIDKEGRRNIILKLGQRYDISGQALYAANSLLYAWKGFKFHRVF